MRMDDRKFMILQAIIDDYIMTAVPVGSRTISRKSGVGFSPATISRTPRRAESPRPRPTGSTSIG